MSEMMNKVSKENIRAGMNLIYTLMKFLSMLLDLAEDTPVACETLTITADGLFEQAAVLYRDLNAYAEAISKFNQRVSV